MAGGASLESRLVEIHGLQGPLAPQKLRETDPEPEAVDVNGLVGRAVWWDYESQKYTVHTFDARYFAVREENLKEYTPPPAEEGGFDLAWPSSPEAYPDFALAMSDVLANKNWCVVQMIASAPLREQAVAKAKGLSRSKVLCEEFVPDYLGRNGRGKTTFLETEIPDVDSLDSLKTDALSLFDRNLTNVAGVCAPIAWDRMGFHFGDRTKGMVVTPYADKHEEVSLKPQPITDEDVDDGLVADHVCFLQRRKLCLMTLLENEGGFVSLIPRPDSTADPVSIKLTTQKLLVFRCDQLTFRYEPVGESVILQAWVLERPPNMQLSSIDGDAQSKALAMGILQGRPNPEGDRVHVMAVHSRLPGGGYGSDEYWSMLLEGTDGMGVIPHLRWDTDIYCTKEDEPAQPGKCYTIHGGFCAHEEIYSFDNKFFEISDYEAQYMAPTQRVVLEDGYTILFKGGYNKASMSGANIGFFLGDTGSDWQPFNFVEYQVPTSSTSVMTTYGVATTAVTGANNSVTASRLNHQLNLVGPVSTADTACSSSLVATGVAMGWLRPRQLPAGLAHMENRLYEAIAGGVCTQIGPGSYIGMCSLSMISKNGRCFTFDESGDGYARGEGVGLMYLKASADEKDRINQVSCLLSSQINQDGRSASMTAPNGPSQQACIQASMKEAGNEARDINLAECHGTGTALGDPIEVGALRNAMEPRDTALALTSSKSNIGHLEGGAGIAGLLKCILMLEAGTCPPNAHCRQLNPHLSVSGFPCFFDTEAIDTMLNAALTGVSSFGFGGTNGRCDIWGQAKFGVRKSGEMDLEELDQITITCPITMGQIDHITGEPKLRPGGDRERYRADVIRDEFAPYDISRYAYSGGFRYRRTEVPEDEDEGLPDGYNVYVCGSWSGWTKMEEMEYQEDGWYAATVVLGEARYEMFDLCLNEDRQLTIYPAIHKAQPRIWVQGPDAAGSGDKWLIDGRDAQVPAGAVYRIHFKWSTQRMECYWEEADSSLASTALAYNHAYYVVGGFSKSKSQAMVKAPGANVWEGTYKIGAQGKEIFQLLRDRDPNQAIYPAQHKLAQCGLLCRGPDDLGQGKFFTVRGQPGESVTIRLEIEDAAVTVNITSESRGGAEWKSLQGYERHSYSVMGTFNDGRPIAMTMDPSEPGIFRCRVLLGETFSEDFMCFVEFFQVVVDDDPVHAFYPEAGPSENSGKMIVLGPDARGGDNCFCVKSVEPGRSFDVVLDLNAEDRRRIVTWSPASVPGIMN